MPTMSEKYVLFELKMLLRFNIDPLSESHFILLKEKMWCNISIRLLIRCPFMCAVL